MKALLLAATIGVAASAAAKAATLLSVDLNTTNRITISATGALSPLTATSSDETGLLLTNLFSFGREVTDDDPGLTDTLLSGELRPTANVTDGSPNLFRERDGSRGLNFWSAVIGSTMSFEAGTAAFTGSATWSLEPFDYANAFAGARSGRIFLNADSDSAISGGVALGEWERVPLPVPLPAAWLLLLGALGGLAAFRRRA